MQSNPSNRMTAKATVTARAAILRILLREGDVTLLELEHELPHGKSTMYKAIDRLRVSGAVGIRSGHIREGSRRSKILYLKDISPRLVLHVTERRMTAYWSGDAKTSPAPLSYTCTPGMTLLENAYVFLSRVADEQMKPYTDRNGLMIYPPVLVWDGAGDMQSRLCELAREVLGARGMMLEDNAEILTVSEERARLAGISYLSGTANATSALILQVEPCAVTGWIAARETPAHNWFFTSLGQRLPSRYRDMSGHGFYAGVAAYLGSMNEWISPDIVVLDTAWHEPLSGEITAMRQVLPNTCALHVMADRDRLMAYGAAQLARLAYYGVKC